MSATPLSVRQPFAPSRGLILALAAITLFRLWAAAVIPLTEDEAYYRLWAATPQFGYFDHPPMIAWWIALGRAIAGDTPLGVRLVPVLSSTAASLMLLDLAAQLGASRAVAQRAALWSCATFLIGAGGVLAVPDSGSAPFWVLTLCCLARTQLKPGLRWWAAAGVAAGLACLSKYSALFLAPGAVLWLASDAQRRKSLATPGPWLAALLAAAVFSPNIVWNAQHHWLTFAKQFGRVAPGRLAPGYVIELVVGQALLLNPLITAFLVAAARRRESGGPQLGLVWATTAPFAAYLLVHALHDRVQAHWPVPLYPGLALAAAVGAERWATPLAGGLRRAVAPVGLGLSALALLHLALPQTDLPRGRDPAEAVRGWPAFAAGVDRIRAAGGAAWIGTLSYGVTGQLAAQAQTHAPVVGLVERARYPAADPSWGADLARPGLVVDLQRRGSTTTLGRCFAWVRDLGPLDRAQGGRQAHYEAWLVAHPTAMSLAGGCRPLQ